MKAFPLSDTGDTPERVPCPVSVPNGGNRESADSYRRIVARLNARWRVVECRDGIQWILQFAKKSGHGAVWRGRSYCRTREAVKRVCALQAGDIDATANAMLESLPDWIGGRP